MHRIVCLYFYLLLFCSGKLFSNSPGWESYSKERICETSTFGSYTWILTNQNVIVSPSAPDAMMKFPAECRELGIKYLYDPSQQVLRLEGTELARDMEGAHFLFCNDYEFGLISKKTGWSLDQILEHVKVLVITRGKDGADLYSDGNSVHIPTVPENEIVDPTGVGDAFRGGFLTGYSHGFDWKLCGEIGSLSAVYCLEQRGTQNHSYTAVVFVKRFRQHFDDGGRLDVFLK